MTVTITWEGVLLTIIAALVIVLLIYLIALIRKTMTTLNKVNSVLDDTKVVSGIASDKAQKVDKMVDAVGESVGTVVNSMKGNQSIVAAITNIINAVSSFAGIVRKPNIKEIEGGRKNESNRNCQTGRSIGQSSNSGGTEKKFGDKD